MRKAAPNNCSKADKLLLLSTKLNEPANSMDTGKNASKDFTNVGFIKTPRLSAEANIMGTITNVESDKTKAQGKVLAKVIRVPNELALRLQLLHNVSGESPSPCINKAAARHPLRSPLAAAFDSVRFHGFLIGMFSAKGVKYRFREKQP